MLNNRTCGQCALPQHNGGVCPLFNETFPSNAPGCPKFSTQLTTCELCKRFIIPSSTIIDATENTLHFICESCRQETGHCSTCKNAHICAFETDPSPIPKVVQKEFRQGNMISVTQVKNPERIDKTCKNGCKCFDPEFGCLRQNNSCRNYKIIYGE